MNSFGLDSQHWELLQKLAIEPLKKLGAKVYVFGSRARRDHQKFSDIDLLIEGNVDPRALNEIREALEESKVPIKVDLVPEKELAESYRENITRDRILI